MTSEELAATLADAKTKLADAKAKIAATMPPGWYDLLGCTPFRSFDGSKLLVLSMNNTVTNDDLEGRWEFNKEAQRYTVTLGGRAQSYALLNNEDAGVCILVSGELSAADLKASWFSKIEDDWSNYEPDER